MTSVEFVEKALIGSLLNDSNRREDVPWLQIEDFTNPLCRAIWRHLESGNPPQCQPLIDLVEMSEILGRDYELHPRLRSPAELVTLQIQAPQRPAVVEYGRILVQATIRREVAAMGLQLQSLAKSGPEQIIDAAANALATLEGMDQRWQVSTDHPTAADPDIGKVSSSLTSEGSSPTTGSRSRTGFLGDDDMDHQMAEKAVIGAAVHDWPPGARAQVLDRVLSSDFTTGRAVATWLAVERLAEHGAPIDEVTVAWQVLRAGNRSGDGLTVQELRETRSSALFHEAGAATLARSTLTRVVDQAKIAISRCAEDLRIDPAAIIDSAATHHVAAAWAAQRLTGEHLENTPLVAVRNRLLARTQRSPVPLAATSAMRQRPLSYRLDSRSLHTSS